MTLVSKKTDLLFGADHLKEAAIWYAEHGLKVFPMYPKDKKSRIKGWKDGAASDDPKQVEEWWNKWPDSNIGIPTGEQNGGLVVVDLDVDKEKGKDGIQNFKKWAEAEGITVPLTMAARSGRDGLHLYFRTDVPMGNYVGWIKDVDIRGIGGCIVAPPSVHPNGNIYRWEVSPEDVPPVSSWDNKAVDHICKRIAGIRKPGEKDMDRFELPEVIHEGQRNDTLYKYACSLQAKGKNDQDILSLCKTANHIKCSSPIPEKELEAIVNSALKRDKGTPKESSAKDNRLTGQQYKQEVITLPEPKRADIKNRPPQSPELIKGVVRRGHKMLLQGGSKIGKTFLQIELACSVIAGKEWLGMECEKGKVLYLNMELDEGDFMQRLADVSMNMGISEDDLMENLYIWHLRGQKCTLNGLSDSLKDYAKKLGAILIIVDPIYKVFEGQENDSESVAKFCSCLDDIARDTNCTMCYCHHHSKGNQGNKKAMDRSSGSGVFARDADALIDFIEIDPKDVGVLLEDEEKAFRVSFTLRSFKYMSPFEITFKYPVHGRIKGLEKAGEMVGGDGAAISKLGNMKKAEKKGKNIESLINAVKNPEIHFMDEEGETHRIDTVKYAALYFDTSEKTIRNWIRQTDGRLIAENGKIILIPDVLPEGEGSPVPDDWDYQASQIILE